MGAGVSQILHVAAFILLQISNLQLLELDAFNLSKKLQDGSISAVQLMEATLEKIADVNPHRNAIILLRDRRELLHEARLADEAIPRKGWLHGIPIAIKDTANAAGIATTFGGSPLHENCPVPLTSDPHVQRLQDAGAIIIGKTNTPEAAVGSHTFNSRWGMTRNAYQDERSAGGSSGGAAVAVASRMLAVADGSDMMGSLRNPAGWNAVYSMRPTAGLLEYEPCPRNPLDYPISTVGGIARSVRDLVLLMETIVGKEKLTAFDESDDVEPPNNRIAWLGNWGGQYPMESGIMTTCRSFLNVLATKGFVIDDISDELFPASDLWKVGPPFDHRSWLMNKSHFMGKRRCLEQHPKFVRSFSGKFAEACR